MITRTIDENGLVGDLFHDGFRRKRKAILLMGGSEGGKSWSAKVVRKRVDSLICSGYTVFSLAYFKLPGLPPTCEEIPLEYFERAMDWLRQQPEALPDEVALLGASKGAEAALLLGGMHPNIKAVIALSPTSVVWEGVPKMGSDLSGSLKSSWIYKGKPLPYASPVGIKRWNLGTLISTMLFATLRKAYEKALQNLANPEEVTIPVEKIQGAILLVSGKRDQMWPSTPMCEQILSRLREKGFAYPSQHIAYDTGHNGYVMQEDFWKAVEGFLKEHYPPS